MVKRQLKTCLLGLGLVILLPLLGHWLRGGRSQGCALDGLPIDSLYRVRIRDEGGAEREFCCIHCAALWLERQDRSPQTIVVTDEASGAEIPAAAAWFVRSMVTTMKATGNRIHAFKNQADAEHHAETFRGTLLEGGERPFAEP